jgi:hypothetical protein
MPRRVEHHAQPQIAPTAGDLGLEAYNANLRHHEPGFDSPTYDGETAGTVPVWKHPEPENAPPGQHRQDAQEVKMGLDLPVQKDHPQHTSGGGTGGRGS